MSELVFFYGTLMTPFKRPGREGIDQHLAFVGRGTITAALFDLGIYPAAVPATEGKVHGEVFEMLNREVVLQALDEIEGYRPAEPEASLYLRKQTPVVLPNGDQAAAWVYFYNAPLGGAQRIASGDYLEYLKVGSTADEGANPPGVQP
jgi:gamma-glutamylcyclotransferase (GGCT)/AIG2-like uncharacterized protein YtfP